MPSTLGDLATRLSHDSHEKLPCSIHGFRQLPPALIRTPTTGFPSSFGMQNRCETWKPWSVLRRSCAVSHPTSMAPIGGFCSYMFDRCQQHRPMLFRGILWTPIGTLTRLKIGPRQCKVQQGSKAIASRSEHRSHLKIITSAPGGHGEVDW